MNEATRDEQIDALVAEVQPQQPTPQQPPNAETAALMQEVKSLARNTNRVGNEAEIAQTLLEAAHTNAALEHAWVNRQQRPDHWRQAAMGALAAKHRDQTEKRLREMGPDEFNRNWQRLAGRG